MSWHTGIFGADVSQGKGLFIWDDYVCLNANWSVHDASAGTNAKVYKCEDAAENVLFYVYVKDNYAGYWEIELWEGWNAVGHAGVGVGIAVSASTYVFRGRRTAGQAWYLSVTDHRVIFWEQGYQTPQYIGAPRRYDESDNIVLILSHTTGTTYNNVLAYIQSGANSACRFLFDELGNSPIPQIDGGQYNNSYRQLKGVDGVLRLPGELAISGSSGLAVGTLEGVIDCGLITNLNFVPVAGETVEIDGEDWMFVTGSAVTKYVSLVKKA